MGDIKRDCYRACKVNMKEELLLNIQGKYEGRSIFLVSP